MKVIKMSVPIEYEPIDQSVSLNEPRRSVVDRYFIKRYYTGQNNDEDICILEHSNRICLVTLAPCHPLVQMKKTVVKVDFQVDDNVNRLDNKVSGRLKRGAQWMNTSATLCRISCDDGSIYRIPGCVKGSLVEVNEHLLSNPQLLVEKTETTGFIAILLTKQQDHKREIAKLKTEEKYQEILLGRKNRKLKQTLDFGQKCEKIEQTSDSKHDCAKLEQDSILEQDCEKMEEAPSVDQDYDTSEKTSDLKRNRDEIEQQTSDSEKDCKKVKQTTDSEIESASTLETTEMKADEKVLDNSATE